MFGCVWLFLLQLGTMAGRCFFYCHVRAWLYILMGEIYKYKGISCSYTHVSALISVKNETNFNNWFATE